MAGSALVLISHEVKDFAVWKKGYDADKPNRDKAGLVELALARDSTNTNMVLIAFQAPSVAAAQQFASNPALKEAMMAAGVVGKPDVKIGSSV
jgi:hypothetical protein